ncbi:MAG: radical SAM family heme chaperone HemW [Alphaproteobacteria bacterium]|nr:radical SAM family heme chaperone HemW [Alphaproteobacteria bacterium]HAU02174.1 YggW family oxidoreductase [Porticoccaceae bacterium]
MNLISQLPPLSLYIHIPWCVRKCPYCDFNSHQASQEIPEQAYIKALLADLQQDLPWAQGRRLSSIFFGGGTPSLFSAAGIGEILTAAERLIGFENDIEITLEANPGTVEQTTFADFRSAGINRLSIGIQSFDDAHLLKLGRIHDGKQAQSAIATVQSAGFQRFNIDLMHGLPGQTVAEAARDIQYAIDGGAVHISWYQLTIEPNTAFYSRPPELPEEDQLSDIQQAGMDMLFDGGYGQYEVSAFAKTGQQARHNINYWEFGDYLGIGAGAHGKITLPSHQQIIRTSKTRQPDHYLSRATSALAKQQTIASDELAMEFMLNGLRLRAGVPKQYFTERTGLPESAIAKQVARLQAQGLLEIDEQRYRTTALGYQFLNSVLQGFS